MINNVSRIAVAALGRVPLGPRRTFIYAATHRRMPRSKNPLRFTDKVNWRIRHDRREVLAPTCDKLAMKDMVSSIAPASVRIPQTLWSGLDLSELDSVDLPDRWILKPAHRFGKIIEGFGRPDIPALTVQTQGWLDNDNWDLMGEWGYSRAIPRLLVEERIGDGRSLPSDYKFFVFNGVTRYVLVVIDRAADTRASYYDADWNRVATHPGAGDLPVVPPPANLDEMFAAAGDIAAGFDFLRVDLYSVDGQIWFGETTAYPMSGLGRYAPDTFDTELGSWWTLPTL